MHKVYAADVGRARADKPIDNIADVVNVAHLGAYSIGRGKPGQLRFGILLRRRIDRRHGIAGGLDIFLRNAGVA